MNIDITKVKTTRGGRSYHHFETIGNSHMGRVMWGGDWAVISHDLQGVCVLADAREGLDLVEEKASQTRESFLKGIK